MIDTTLKKYLTNSYSEKYLALYRLHITFNLFCSVTLWNIIHYFPAYSPHTYTKQGKMNGNSRKCLRDSLCPRVSYKERQEFLCTCFPLSLIGRSTAFIQITHYQCHLKLSLIIRKKRFVYRWQHLVADDRIVSICSHDLVLLIIPKFGYTGILAKFN